MLKQILFNLILFSILLVVLTSWFLTPEQKFFSEFTAVLLFWAGNFYFLHQADKKQFPENLKSLKEYQSALKYHLRKSRQFRFEIRSAIRQLEAFHQKQRTLLAFDKTFEDISQDTEQCLLSNIKKFLHQLLISNPYENSQIRRTYLNHLLSQNEKLLFQYDAFLTEVFQLDSCELPCLDTMTEAIREVRNSLQ